MAGSQENDSVYIEAYMYHMVDGGSKAAILSIDDDASLEWNLTPLEVDGYETWLDLGKRDPESFTITVAGQAVALRDRSRLHGDKGSPITLQANPSIVTNSGQAASFQIGGSVQYFTREEDGTFLLHDSDAAGEGYTLDVEPTIDPDGTISSDIKLHFEWIVGREPLEGTTLDVGRPTSVTFDLKSKVRVASGSLVAARYDFLDGAQSMLFLLKIRRQPPEENLESAEPIDAAIDVYRIARSDAKSLRIDVPGTQRAIAWDLTTRDMAADRGLGFFPVADRESFIFTIDGKRETPVDRDPSSAEHQEFERDAFPSVAMRDGEPLRVSMGYRVPYYLGGEEHSAVKFVEVGWSVSVEAARAEEEGIRARVILNTSAEAGRDKATTKPIIDAFDADFDVLVPNDRALLYAFPDRSTGGFGLMALWFPGE